MKTGTKVKRILMAAFFLMALVSVAKGILNGMTYPVDFLYNSFREAIFDHMYSGPQFPFTFWMIFPLGLLPEIPARAVWILCNLIFTAMIIFVLRKSFFTEMDITDFTVLILIMISGGPWRTNLSNGQYNLAAVAAFLLSVYFSERDWDIPAGILLSMSVFKYQLTVPLAVYYVLRRKYKVIAVTAASLTFSLIATAIWFGGVYNVTLKQFNESRGLGLGEMGDVDLESIFGLGEYIIIFFILGVVLLLIFSFIPGIKRDDTLFIIISLFTAWAFAYQRIYSFFPLIIPLGYSYEKYKDTKERIYFIQLILALLTTAAFFWSRTLSDSLGIILERLFFYPAFLLYIIDAFLPSSDRTVKKSDADYGIPQDNRINPAPACSGEDRMLFGAISQKFLVKAPSINLFRRCLSDSEFSRNKFAYEKGLELRTFERGEKHSVLA